MKQLLLLLLTVSMHGCATRQLASMHFSGLCESEAGIHIFSTVDGVDTIRQMRAPEKTAKKEYYASGKRTSEALSWPVGDNWINDYPSNFGTFTDRLVPFSVEESTPFTNYVFESVSDIDPSRFVRVTSEFDLISPCKTYRCYAETKHQKAVTAIPELKSRYGFTWRELHPEGYPHYIVGIEIQVLDLHEGKVLATAKDFMYFPDFVNTRNGPAVCGKRYGPGESQFNYTPLRAADFVAKVLKPSQYVTRRKTY